MTADVFDVTLTATDDSADVFDVTLATTDDSAGHPAEVQQPGGPALQGEAAARGGAGHEAARHQGSDGVLVTVTGHSVLCTPGEPFVKPLLWETLVFT